MKFAFGGTDIWPQKIVKKDSTIAKKFALKCAALIGNANSYTWLAAIQNDFKRTGCSKKIYFDSLRKDPRDTWAQQVNKDIQKQLHQYDPVCCQIL